MLSKRKIILGLIAFVIGAVCFVTLLSVAKRTNKHFEKKVEIRNSELYYDTNVNSE